MNAYVLLKKKHQEEINTFPMEFAFSPERFAAGMKKLGLSPADTNQVCKLGGGCFLRKTDLDALRKMAARHREEMKEAIASDLTGDEFIFDMFDYELGNHEYVITWDTSETLDALGLTTDDVSNDPRMQYALKKACLNQSR